ncbi:MAG: hypothetical protein II551_02515 [Paludibacteraceae bacterium]|nr:hypothetical protein [Paludibacteraceae bacterium]
MVEVLKYTLPSLIVLFASWLVMYKLFKNEEQKRMWELKKTTQKEINSVRLRAYERMALVLERTQPEHMLLDIPNLSQMTVLQVQKHLLRTIRMEFDHNMSQQIYVSEELWDRFIRARDEMGAFVNTMAIQMPEGSNSLEYAKTLTQAYTLNGDTPSALALAALKEEVRGLW